MKIVVTDAVLRFLAERRIYTSTSANPRLELGDALIIEPDAAIEPYSHILAGNRFPSRLGAFSYSYARLDPAMRIGRYCSISWTVQVMGSAHAAEWAITHPLPHNPYPLLGVRAYLEDQGATSFPLHKFDQGPQQITLGHDVWVGAESLLKRGITLGTGSVVGARSVVTRDVPPFAVVAGAPARIIRYRFSEEQIARMLASRWWDYGPDIIHAADVRDPGRFLDRLEQSINTSARPLNLTPVLGQEIIEVSASGSE